VEAHKSAPASWNSGGVATGQELSSPAAVGTISEPVKHRELGIVRLVAVNEGSIMDTNDDAVRTLQRSDELDRDLQAAADALRRVTDSPRLRESEHELAESVAGLLESVMTPWSRREEVA
jgi:hypothetical protein